jgi:hypothetical protein
MNLSAHHAHITRREAAMALIALNVAQSVDYNELDGIPLRAQPGRPAQIRELEFAPLTPDIVNETIPAFFIGRNKAGLWIAREAMGRTGGVFLFRASALAFAQARSGSPGCATIFPSQRFELDLDNEGNRFAGPLAHLKRIATAGLRMIERGCRLALPILFAGVAMAALIALKTIIYLPHG